MYSSNQLPGFFIMEMRGTSKWFEKKSRSSLFVISFIGKISGILWLLTLWIWNSCTHDLNWKDIRYPDMQLQFMSKFPGEDFSGTKKPGIFTFFAALESFFTWIRKSALGHNII